MKNKQLEALLNKVEENQSESGFIILNDDQAEETYGGWNMFCDANCDNNNC